MDNKKDIDIIKAILNGYYGYSDLSDMKKRIEEGVYKNENQWFERINDYTVDGAFDFKESIKELKKLFKQDECLSMSDNDKGVIDDTKNIRHK